VMQTFLAYPSFYRSAMVLDYRRHGKQRVEAMQIHHALRNPTYGWQNHPAVNMWRGYENALALYHNIVILTWIGKGYNNNMKLLPVVTPVEMPHWLGWKKFHRSHQSNLLRKDFKYYEQHFVGVKAWLGYVWPEGKVA